MIATVVPARGGSKAIPKKNIVDFLGNPLITYTIRQSLASDAVDATFVSTDDDQIASVSKDAGADIIERPERIAGDFADTEDALLHALNEMRRQGVNPDAIVLLQCTSPLRRKGDIDDAISLVTDGPYDSSLSCCPNHKFYWRFNEETGAEPLNYEPSDRSMRQELDERYQENGSIYVVDTEILETEQCRVGGNVGIHKMPETHSFEIDTYDDLTIIESIGEKVTFYDGGLID